MKVVALGVLIAGALSFQPPGAKAIFHSSGDFWTNGGVAVQYWFENARHERFTDVKAASVGGEFRLFIRSNAGGGFLSVWYIEPHRGLRVTPAYHGWSGDLMSDGTYAVPGTFKFNASCRNVADCVDRRLILVFSLSQMEQPKDPANAGLRLEQLTHRGTAAELVRERDDSTPGEIGTYVASPMTGQVAAEIPLRAVGS